jgi:DNA replication protein DnaC
MNQGLYDALRQLRLSGLSHSLDVRLSEAAGNHLSHEQFLELILQDELAVRCGRQVERRVKAAMFRERKNLDEFDFAFNPSIKRKLVSDLATCGFVVLYRSIFDLARDFLHEELAVQQDKMLARYLKPDLLIIDDMGMKQLPRRSGECLLEIIMRRHENRSTMMTSNRPLEDWAKLIGDVPAATAILDRFLQHAQILTITGRSYRLKDHPRVEQTAAQTKGRPPAGGESISPPEDTEPLTALSSAGPDSNPVAR